VELVKAAVKVMHATSVELLKAAVQLKKVAIKLQ
jgi:hypothetical protein